MHELCTQILLQIKLLATGVDLNCTPRCIQRTDRLLLGNPTVKPHFHSSKFQNLPRNDNRQVWPGLGLDASTVRETVSSEWTFRRSHCLSPYANACSVYVSWESDELQERVGKRKPCRIRAHQLKQNNPWWSPKCPHFLFYLINGTTSLDYFLIHMSPLPRYRVFKVHTIACL